MEIKSAEFIQEFRNNPKNRDLRCTLRFKVWWEFKLTRKYESQPQRHLNAVLQTIRVGIWSNILR